MFHSHIRCPSSSPVPGPGIAILGLMPVKRSVLHLRPYRLISGIAAVLNARDRWSTKGQLAAYCLGIKVIVIRLKHLIPDIICSASIAASEVSLVAVVAVSEFLERIQRKPRNPNGNLICAFAGSQLITA